MSELSSSEFVERQRKVFESPIFFVEAEIFRLLREGNISAAENYFFGRFGEFNPSILRDMVEKFILEADRADLIDVSTRYKRMLKRLAGSDR